MEIKHNICVFLNQNPQALIHAEKIIFGILLLN